MSRVTNPEKESSVSCGFYNSLNDRKYDAVQMSKLFDGIINDGVFASIGTCFVVNADSGNTVNVGIGKAWFNHTWTDNDAILPVECGESEILLDRIDAIVIEIDATENVRDNFIKHVKGTPLSSPVRPTMTHTNNINQYPLCYIYRTAGSKDIRQADITNMVGSEETPFITGLMQTISLSELMGKWEDELDQFIEMEEADFSEWYKLMKDLLQEKSDDFDKWFQGIKDQLGEDAAGNLQNQIGSLADLTTLEKSDLVTAINEVNKKEPDVLDTMEEIEANTDAGKSAGALAVKELSSELRGHIVWTNPNPASNFAAQSVTLLESLNNYSYAEIVYKGVNNVASIKTTGKLPIIEGLAPYLEYTSDYAYRRQITEFFGTTITFADAMYFSNPSTSHVTNNLCIPYRVILYAL